MGPQENHTGLSDCYTNSFSWGSCLGAASVSVTRHSPSAIRGPGGGEALSGSGVMATHHWDTLPSR
jgi:hypothetical protein